METTLRSPRIQIEIEKSLMELKEQPCKFNRFFSSRYYWHLKEEAYFIQEADILLYNFFSFIGSDITSPPHCYELDTSK